MATLGLELNPRKTLVWSPQGVQAVPAEVRAHAVPVLPALGSHLCCRGDTQEAPHQLGGTGQLADATERLVSLWQQLQRLQKAGLQRQATAALLRTYAGSASQHALRLTLTPEQLAKTYDEQLAKCWNDLAERPLEGKSLTLLGPPARLGGAGVQFAEARRCAAFFASWSTAAKEVADDLGCSTVADCLDRLPTTAAQLEEARSGLVRQGVRLADGTSLADAVRHPVAQSVLMEKVQKTTLAALLQQLPFLEQAEVRGAGGSGSAGFLAYPTEAATSVENTYWSTALRQRLLVCRAECSLCELAAASPTCTQKNSAGVVCGAPLDDRGFHSCTCQSGGGVLRRHGKGISAIGSLARRWKHEEPLTEQRVPAWDRPSRRSQGGAHDGVERAILDLEYREDDGRMWIDVSARHPAAGSAREVRTAARRDGEAARRGEREKHARYPGSRLVPFVLETPGRVGGEARHWLKAQTRQLPEDQQAKELSRAYKVLSCALQSQVASQLRKAAGLR